MTLADVYRRSGRTSPVISYELFPPRVPDPHSAPWAGIVKLLNSRPEYVSVTFGASGSSQELSRTVLRQVLQRTGRPGLAHLTCVGRNRQQLDRLISELIAEGIRDFLALRGDPPRGQTRWVSAPGGLSLARLATSGVLPTTQVHTHLCYSEFAVVVDAIDNLDADVTSIEASRSKMDVLSAVAEHGFSRQLGPGIWDIHSPHIPTLEEEVALLRAATAALDPRQLWVNPDCGLKTRAYPETIATLRNLVAAAAEVRDEVSS